MPSYMHHVVINEIVRFEIIKEIVVWTNVGLDRFLYDIHKSRNLVYKVQSFSDTKT